MAGGHLKRRGCPSGKWVYDDEKYALKALRFKKSSGEMKSGHPYRCNECPGWHLTSQRKLKGFKR